jgi:hypothetical protein
LLEVVYIDRRIFHMENIVAVGAYDSNIVNGCFPLPPFRLLEKLEMMHDGEAPALTAVESLKVESAAIAFQSPALLCCRPKLGVSGS